MNNIPLLQIINDTMYNGMLMSDRILMQNYIARKFTMNAAMDIIISLTEGMQLLVIVTQ